MWEDKIYMIEEQFNDILEKIATRAGYSFTLKPEEKKNPYGGNPERSVSFSAVINDIPYKDKKFTWHLASQSETDFINSVKSYLFDVLDGAANM